MNEVEQIVEEVLLESGFDWDHPVVPYLVEDVEQMLYELSNKTLNKYRSKSSIWPAPRDELSPNRATGNARAQARLDKRGNKILKGAVKWTANVRKQMPSKMSGRLLKSMKQKDAHIIWGDGNNVDSDRAHPAYKKSRKHLIGKYTGVK